jgi:hypothetical protein
VDLSVGLNRDGLADHVDAELRATRFDYVSERLQMRRGLLKSTTLRFELGDELLVCEPRSGRRVVCRPESSHAVILSRAETAFEQELS